MKKPFYGKTVTLQSIPFTDEYAMVCPYCNSFIEHVSFNEREGKLEDKHIYYDYCDNCKVKLKNHYEGCDIKEMIEYSKPFLKIKDLDVKVFNQKSNEKIKEKGLIFATITHSPSGISSTHFSTSEKIAKKVATQRLDKLVHHWNNALEIVEEREKEFEIKDMSDEQIMENLESYGIEIVSQERVSEIIEDYDEETKKYNVSGKFLVFEKDGTFSGIYNEDGDCSCEGFENLNYCVRWLEGEMMDDHGRFEDDCDYGEDT